MPSLDTFGRLSFDDQEGIKAWLMAHQFRHSTYAKALSRLGISVTSFSLSEHPDRDWFSNHLQAHSLLLRFSAQDPTVSLTGLADGSWDDEQSFYDWHQMHTLIHQRIDQGMGITDAH